MRMALAWIAGLVIFSNVSIATTGGAQGAVQNVQIYGDGGVLVTGFNFAGASCSNNGGFYIPGTHPMLARLLANVLAARATGATMAIVAQIDGGCWYPTITTDTATYVTILSN